MTIAEGRLHTVLVVDDEAEVVESLRRALRNEKLVFVGTTRPTEALARCAQGDVDLVIADIDMPEMDGLSLVAKIRARHPDVVRVLLTGDTSVESALAAINQGEVHRFLTKPWDTAELRETVRRALERLDELRRASRASQRMDAQRAMADELSRAHPGIGDVVREEGAYVLDVEHLRGVLMGLSDAKLRQLFDADATIGARGEITRRSGS